VLDIILPSEGAFSADGLAPVAQVDGDAQLLELWLHGRSEHTQRAYRTDAGSFLAFVSKPLRTVTVGDVQAWIDTLEHWRPARVRARSRLSNRCSASVTASAICPSTSAVSSNAPSSKTRWLSASCRRATSSSCSPPRSSRRFDGARRSRKLARGATTFYCVSCTPPACVSMRSRTWPGATCTNVATPAR
jgi:hypothetical protein